MQVKNYILGEWVSGKGEEINHFHSITGEHISSTSVRNRLQGHSSIWQGERSLHKKNDLSTKRRNAQVFSPLFTQGKEILYELSKATGATKLTHGLILRENWKFIRKCIFKDSFQISILCRWINSYSF